MQIGKVLVGHTWHKPATIDISLNREWQFFAIQIGTLVLYADWQKY